MTVLFTDQDMPPKKNKYTGCSGVKEDDEFSSGKILVFSLVEF